MRPDARRQTEDHLSGVEAGGRVGTAHGLEGGDAGTGGLGQLVQPAAHEDAVLPAQAHDVGQRAQGHKIQHLVHLEAAARVRGQGRVDGGHEEEGHAHTGQMGAGHVVFRAQTGIADGVGRGQFRRRQVVVGDDHGHAQLAGTGHGRHVGDAAVHGEQDAAALREWFAPEAEVYWHCTDERFTAEEYIRANCEYPGDWEGAVERAEWTEDGCVSVAAVWPKDRSARFHAVSFFRFAGGRITRLDEYWADDGPPPQWRKEKHIGSSIGRS